MLIDISRPIHSAMAIYPGNPGVELLQIQKAGVEQSGLTAISLGSHTGTHIDALSHINASNSGIESFSLDQYVGDCEVVEIPPDVAVITSAHIPETGSKRIIFKTANSNFSVDEFRADFTALDESAAEKIAQLGIVLVGLDALSIKKKGIKDRVHEILLTHNIVIVEGLYLPDIQPGPYQLMCLPLSIPGIDGVPARAVLSSYEN
ncbi:MAG: cyclase family protein [Candidatus Andersenbacteria bacterium]|nr:cyclase family protein [Candidatus Andersenbacteria bacterium]